MHTLISLSTYINIYIYTHTHITHGDLVDYVFYNQSWFVSMKILLLVIGFSL